jgi:hypothetical protein
MIGFLHDPERSSGPANPPSRPVVPKEQLGGSALVPDHLRRSAAQNAALVSPRMRLGCFSRFSSSHALGGGHQSTGIELI